jgi:hypothetical protein
MARIVKSRDRGADPLLVPSALLSSSSNAGWPVSDEHVIVLYEDRVIDTPQLVDGSPAAWELASRAFTLAAIAQNLRRLAKLAARPRRPRTQR